MEIFFEEKQKFNQWWLWVILVLFPILSVWPFKAYEINIYHVLIGIALPLFFYFLELRIKINKEGLYYQFFPIHFKRYLIKIQEIEKIEAIKYNPLLDYGGWGIRHGIRGKAYNVRGNKGVKIYLLTGKNILFGSQKHKELQTVLQQLRDNN